MLTDFFFLRSLKYNARRQIERVFAKTIYICGNKVLFHNSQGAQLLDLDQVT